MPKRFQRQRTRGWRTPEGGVNCTRPGRLGNPWVHDDPAVAAAAYESMLHGDLSHVPGLRLAKGQLPVNKERADEIRILVEGLRGKDCGCFCALDAPCHVDGIIRFANRRHGG